MGVEPAKAEPARYRAFISYSHGDAKFAHWLHRKLESWRLPDKSRLTPVFIDRAELAAGSDLSAQVREALEQSAALVVVCSPNARASRWVGQEIALFRSLHPDRPVLAALIDGEPGAAFPDPLLGTGEAPLEPLAADFRKGHDGQRLGLLKLAAGLTKLPLDRLVQRDVQSRQRRVMAITAAALALVLILSAALVIALRARAEAERQRAEAEGLVEFMLTDLRDKLKGVGSLEVMDTVNQRALAHYQGETGSSSLPKDTILRRAKLLQSMGEDDLQSKLHRQRGELSIKLAWQITGETLRTNPQDPDAIWAHAQSEYWMGYVRYLRSPSGSSTRKQEVGLHWLQYRDLTARLSNRNPANREWQLEAGYADSNLCALHASPISKEALPYCTSAAKRLEAVAAGGKIDIDARLNLISTYGWKADVEFSLGQAKEALKTRRLQRAAARSLAEDFASDIRTLEALLTSNLGGAKLLIDSGFKEEALPIIKEADILANKLIKRDPTNRDWESWRAQLDKYHRLVLN